MIIRIISFAGTESRLSERIITFYQLSTIKLFCHNMHVAPSIAQRLCGVEDLRRPPPTQTDAKKTKKDDFPCYVQVVTLLSRWLRTMASLHSQPKFEQSVTGVVVERFPRVSQQRCVGMALVNPNNFAN